MVADTKKVQTLINRMSDVVECMREARAIKDAYLAANPSVAGTPLEGNLAAVNAWMNDLFAVADSPIAQSFINNNVPSHRGDAL